MLCVVVWIVLMRGMCMAKCESALSITLSPFPCSSTFLSLPKVALHADDRLSEPEGT